MGPWLRNKWPRKKSNFLSCRILPQLCRKPSRDLNSPPTPFHRTSPGIPTTALLWPTELIKRRHASFSLQEPQTSPPLVTMKHPPGHPIPSLHWLPQWLHSNSPYFQISTLLIPNSIPLHGSCIFSNFYGKCTKKYSVARCIATEYTIVWNYTPLFQTRQD